MSLSLLANTNNWLPSACFVSGACVVEVVVEEVVVVVVLVVEVVLLGAICFFLSDRRIPKRGMSGVMIPLSE